MQTSIFSEFLLPASLSVIMIGMGMSLERRDFKNVILYPRAMLTGIMCQLIILPIIAFLLMWFSGLDPVFKVGFIIITACAGGAATNLITHLLRGNVALSISLTAINSLIVLVSLPLIVNLALVLFLGEERELHLPVMNTVANIMLTIIIPTIAGMSIRYHFYRFTVRMQKPLKVVLPSILLVVFIVVMFFDNPDGESDVFGYLHLLPWALGLNFISMLAVYLTAKFMRLGGKNNFTLSIEVGLKNSIIGIYVARSLIGDHDMTMVSVIYGSFTFFSTLLFGYIFKRFEIGWPRWLA